MTDTLVLVFESGLKEPSDRDIHNHYNDLHVATLTSFTKIIKESDARAVLDFSQTLCQKIMMKKILRTDNGLLVDDVCNAAVKFLSQVLTIQGKPLNRFKRNESKTFWKELLINDGLLTNLETISNDIMEMETASKSVKLFLTNLGSLI